MFEKATLGRKLAIGFGLAAVILLVVVFTAYRSMTLLIVSDRQVEHSYQVRNNLSELIAQLLNAETGERGYIITGDDNYLAPYQLAGSQIRAIYNQVKQLTVDNAAQQRRLTAMLPLIDDLLVHHAQTIDARRTGGFDAALKLVQTNRAKTLMDQIRALVAEATQEEADLLQTRRTAATSSILYAILIVFIGTVVGVVLDVLVGWFISRSVTNQVGAAVERVRGSSVELQAVANQQATGTREQSAAMTEISTTITELLATSRQIAESAQRVAEIASQTAGGARSGQGGVDLAQEAIGGIRRQVDQIVAYMLELGRKSQQIGSVLEIVAELSEQTNILAINATIEAVGAGENGRRFGVVADENRKLADRVGNSAKEIRALIDDVRSAVNTTVMATEAGSKAVDAGARQFGEVAANFGRIADLVATTTDAAREIGLSTKQQTSAVEQVNVAISSVSQAARETEASAGQTLQTASELAQLSAGLARIVRRDAA